MFLFFCHFICPLHNEAWIMWADVLVSLPHHLPTAQWSLNCVGGCIGIFAISSAHGTMKLELCGQMYWYFRHFICPRHNEAWISQADVLVFSPFHLPTAQWSLNLTGGCIGIFAISSAHGTMKLESHGRMHWLNCHFIWLSRNSIRYSYIMLFLK